MLISEFIDRIALRLRDQSKRQWTQAYLVQATDAAFQALCDVIPQAYTVHRDMTLVAGTEQTIDSDLHRIIHIIGNVCESGTMKRAVTKTDLSVMDRQHPQWRQDASRGYVWNYMLNALSEQKYFVWPPAPTGRGAAPTVVADPGPVTSGLGPLTEYVPQTITAVNDPGDTSVIGITVSPETIPAGKKLGLLMDISAVTAASLNNDFSGSNSGIGVGITGGAAYQVQKNFNYSATTESGNAPTDNNFLFKEDILFAQSEGRNLFLLSWPGSSASTMISGFVATVAELPRLVDKPIDHAAQNAILGSEYNSNNLENTGTAGEMVVAGGSDVDELLIQALPIGSFFSMGMENNSGNNETNRVYWTLQNGLQYTFDYTNRYDSSEYNSAGSKLMSHGTSYKMGMTVWSHPVVGTPGILIVNTITNTNIDAYFIEDPTGQTTPGDTVTQAQVDAYDAYVIAQAAWLAGSPDVRLRIQAAATPSITVGGGVTPTAPTAPVDPGALGLGANVAGSGYVTDSVLVNGNELVMVWDNAQEELFYTPYQTLDVLLPDVSGMSGTVSINEIIKSGSYSSGGTFDTLDDTDESTPLVWGDARLVTGAVLRILFDTTPHLVGVNLYNEGVTQTQIDTYDAALIQYNIDLPAHNALIALPELYIDEDIPFDKVHLPALEEWALYYCLMRDGEETANSGRAMQHHQNFYQLLNKRDDTDVSIKTGEGESEV